MDSFVLLKFATNAMLPPASVALCVVLGVALAMAGFRRTGKTLAALAVVQGILLSMPPVADALIQPLERDARQASQVAKTCCYSAIVLLGGGIVPADPPEMPRSHLIEGADRIVYAAQLFHQHVAPRIVVSGGRVREGPIGESEAVAMKSLLVQLGVPAEAIILEDQSRDTLDNIAFVQMIVRDASVALVTSAYHMPRALRIARRVGLDASAFPTDWHMPWSTRTSWGNWLPTLYAESTSTLALREYLAAAFDFRKPRLLPPLANLPGRS